MQWRGQPDNWHSHIFVFPDHEMDSFLLKQIISTYINSAEHRYKNMAQPAPLHLLSSWLQHCIYVYILKPVLNHPSDE